MNINESVCVRHTRCPRCTKRGGDTRGDNLGVYDDGHAFCFNCKFYDPRFSQATFGRGTSTQSQRKTTVNGPTTQARYGGNAACGSTSEAIRWLRQFGITAADQELYGIRVEGERVTFSLRKGKEVVLTNTRYFGSDPNEPKYRTKGKRSEMWDHFGSNEIHCIVVEDVLSAIAVAKAGYSSYPCCGSGLPKASLAALARRWRHLGIWLDPDMRPQALKMALRAQQWGCDARPIYSDKDPKYYDKESIHEIVRRNTGWTI